MTHYLNSRRLILANIWPANFLQWVFSVFILFGFCYVVRWDVAIQAVVPWGAVWIFILAAFFATPPKVVYWFLNLPGLVQCLLAGLTFYVSVVLLAHAIDLKNFDAVWEILTVTKGAPLTASHIVGAVGAFYFFKRNYYDGKPALKPAEIFLRGPKLISEDEAKNKAAAVVAAEGRHEAEKNKPAAASTAQGNAAEKPALVETINWGMINIPASRGTENFLLVGAAGSGKSITLQFFLQSLVKLLTPKTNRRLLIYDAKRDAFPALKGYGSTAEIKLLNPFDARCYAWDIARDLQNLKGEDKHNLGIELASIILPVEGTQPYFAQAGQALMGGIIEALQIITTPKEPKPGEPVPIPKDRWTLRDVVLATRTQERMKIVLTEGGQTTEYLSKIYLGDAAQDRAVASTMENKLRRLTFIAAGWEKARTANPPRTISLRQWLTEESILVLGAEPEADTTIKQLNDVMFKRLVQLVRMQEDTTSENKRQTWIVIDELRHSGKLPGLEVLLTFGRSKGVCCVLAFQDVPGLEYNYDNKNLAHEIVGACENKGFLRTTDQTTQQFASLQFGTQEVDIPRTGTSQGTSSGPGGVTVSSGTSFHYQLTTRPVILPSQFAEDLPRPDKAQGIGIKGYYQTGCIHAPFKSYITSAVIKDGLSKPSTDAAFEERPEKDFVLQDWTWEDLQRLNLTQHAEKLGVRKPGEEGNEPEQKAADAPKPPPKPSPAHDWRGVTSPDSTPKK